MKLFAGLIALLTGSAMWSVAKAEGAAPVALFGRLTEAQAWALAEKITSQYFPQVSPRMLVAMAKIESSFNPQAVRREAHLGDSSIGLLQTLLGTAYWLWKDMGAKAYGEPTEATLKNPEVSMYFGAAMVNWLRKYRNQLRSEEWIVRAYNGGQGWQSNPTSVEMTANHWRKYQAAVASLGK